MVADFALVDARSAANEFRLVTELTAHLGDNIVKVFLEVEALDVAMHCLLLPALLHAQGLFDVGQPTRKLLLDQIANDLRDLHDEPVRILGIDRFGELAVGSDVLGQRFGQALLEACELLLHDFDVKGKGGLLHGQHTDLEGLFSLLDAIRPFEPLQVAQDHRVRNPQRQCHARLTIVADNMCGMDTRRTYGKSPRATSPCCPSPEEHDRILVAAVWPNRTSSRPGRC